MEGNKITPRPPRQRTAQDFILEAEKKVAHKEEVVVEKERYPWVGNGERSDVQKVFTVKLIEEYILKIRYISEVTNKSQQKIVREIINTGIDKIIKSMET